MLGPCYPEEGVANAGTPLGMTDSNTVRCCIGTGLRSRIRCWLSCTILVDTCGRCAAHRYRTDSGDTNRMHAVSAAGLRTGTRRRRSS